MKEDELTTISKLHNDIRVMKPLRFLLKPDMRKKFEDIEQQLTHSIKQIVDFNDRFSDYGWCVFDNMEISIVECANQTFDQVGLDAAEQVLIRYFKTDIQKIMHKIKNSSDAFAIRATLIQQFFDEHFAERYYASVPLGLIIIDGAVNDFTKSKGFFASGTDVDAWDCLVGCSDGLKKMKDIFNKNRTKTNCEPITLPYRNGILHGRDLNYANEYVACKCVALMFVVADWMRMKTSEEKRKADYEKLCNPPPLRDSLARLQENRQINKEIGKWKARSIVVGTDIPQSGSALDYREYPYIGAVIDMLQAWKEKNYGKLSNTLQRAFASDMTDGKRAGECRKLFERKDLIGFQIIEVEERGCGLSKVELEVCWMTDSNERTAKMIFGVSYESTVDEHLALPWRNNGKWILIPWDISELYRQ